MKAIAITGTIGSGKSLVGRFLEELNVPVIDTDKVVHYLLSEDTPTRAAVVERFGKEIQNADGSINRKTLGSIVFTDAAQRKTLEAIVHPAVRAECRRRTAEFAESGKHPIVAVLIPLLFEAGLGPEYDEIWTVLTNESVLRERLKHRDNMTEEEIDRRLHAQWPQEKKAALANFTIDNSQDMGHTRSQVEAMVHERLAATS